MPDELILDLSRDLPIAVTKAMTTADATQLASHQADSQARDAAAAGREQAARAALVAFMANPLPTGAETIAALKAVVRILARDL